MQLHSKAEGRPQRTRVRWEYPPSGRLKINIDGFYCVDDGVGGIGVIIRNDVGVGIAALSKQFRFALSVLLMEVEACRAGLELGLRQNCLHVDLESDSILLIAALN